MLRKLEQQADRYNYLHSRLYTPLTRIQMGITGCLLLASPFWITSLWCLLFFIDADKMHWIGRATLATAFTIIVSGFIIGITTTIVFDCKDKYRERYQMPLPEYLNDVDRRILKIEAGGENE